MKIEISTSYDLPGLAGEWMELERRADGNFFLSWRWMSGWLRTTGARPLLVRVSENGTTLALGLMTARRRKRFFLSVSQLYLHETGVAEFDALTIEYNNFLIARSAPPETLTQIFGALQNRPEWDEIVLGGVEPHILSAARAAGLHVETDADSPVFGVDLSAGMVEDRVSQNLRAQIRQSRALAERAGPLALAAARSTEEALEFFEQLAALHNAYWQGRGKPGAFATDFSRKFHRTLIQDQGDLARVELLQLTAGNEILGYLYNFLYAGRVCNYQSGFSYSSDNRHRPGLIAHVMAMEQAKNRGLLVYDFLAGDAHYKARLGAQMGQMVWCRLQKNRPRLVAERALRGLRQRLRG